MRELPGVNDIFKPKSNFNPELRKLVDREKRVHSIEDYIAVINGAKTVSDIENPIEWVSPKETQVVEEEEER